MIFEYTAIESPVGRLYLALYENQLCSLSLGESAKEKLFEYLKSINSNAEIQASKPDFTIIIRQLNEYFAGQRTEFDLALNLKGTPFQKSVWDS